MNVKIDAGSGFFESMPIFVFLYMGAVGIIHIIFAISVYVDGSERGTRLVWPSVWALVVLVGGPLTAAAYWVVCRLAIDINVADQSRMENMVSNDKIKEHQDKLRARREKDKQKAYRSTLS